MKNKSEERYGKIFQGDKLDKQGYHYNLSREMLKDYLEKIAEEKRKKEQEDKFPFELPGKKPRPCLHEACPECHGSGRKKNGQICVHMLSCKCIRCMPYYL